MRSISVIGARFSSATFFRSVVAIASAMSMLRGVLTCFAVLAILASHASAVIIVNADGSADNGQNSLAGTPAYYASVGVRGNNQASVVYLGNGWAITNDHVAVIPGDVNYGFVQLYNQKTDEYEQFQVTSTTQIFNSGVTPASLNGTPTDLKLIQLAANPDLSSVTAATIASSNPSSGQTITMIGAGMDLGTEQGKFNGYTYYNLLDNDSVPRWGTNVIYSVPSSLTSIGSTYDYAITAWFNSPSGTNQEALDTYGDSGGGVFNQSGVLVGLMDEDNGPLTALSAQHPTGFNYATDAYIGEESTMINLYDYQAAITADMVAVPEPSGWILAGLGAILTWLVGLRARRQTPGTASGPGLG
jgi:hypothetical protein